MAKRKQEESGGGGAPAWMATFSDLMNLLLCFFVLLFSMSSVDADKWEQIVASMSSAFSVFSGGSSAIGQGTLVGVGTSQLSELDEYYSDVGQTSEDNGEDHKDTSNTSEGSNADDKGGPNKQDDKGGKTQDPDSGKTPDEDVGGKTKDDNDDSGKTHDDNEGGKNRDDNVGGKTLIDELNALGRAETEEMLDSISEMTERYNISEKLEVSMDQAGKYVEITLSGSLLFESGSAELQTSCLPLLSKVGDILKVYSKHDIDVIGHTDNVPMRSATFKDNDMLSSARAISAAQYLVKEKGIDVTRLSWTGRGEYEPVASNATAEGRARNRRIEIRIYNSYSSN